MKNWLRDFYADKTVLLTGHTGFKGGWLAIWLRRLGARVIGYALPPRTPSLYEQAHIGCEMDSIMGDIRDRESMLAVFVQRRPEIVFHLAAQSLVRYSYAEPTETFETNVLGTINVMEGLRAAPSVRSAVIITTDKCYENQEWVWAYRENDILGGRDPYSASKACAELAVKSYRESYFSANNAPRIATTRAGNVIGGGDWGEDRLVPDIVRALSRGHNVDIRNPGSIRPWQHVLDPLYGYLLLGAYLYEGRSVDEAWNFGPDYADAVSVQSLAEKLVALWASSTKLRFPEQAGQFHEAGRLHLDSSKARERLGWTPRWSLDNTLRMTIAGYKACLESPAEANRALEAQIETYLKENSR